MPVGDQDKRWAPHVICDYCRRTLEGWLRGEKGAMRFAISRIWREPSNHYTDCYFCMVDPTKRREKMHLQLSILTFHHSLPLFLITPPTCLCHSHPQEINLILQSSEDSKKEEGAPSSSSSVLCRRRRVGNERCPYYPNQEDINDLIREMALTKSNAELLISRLKQWDLLDEGIRITSQRKRHRGFSTFFSFREGLCYCHDIRGLFEAIGIPCNTSDWRLFIDSLSKSLKAQNVTKAPCSALSYQ